MSWQRHKFGNIEYVPYIFNIVVIENHCSLFCMLFVHLQPEKMAEGLLLFIQGLGLGKISILHVFLCKSH